MENHLRIHSIVRLSETDSPGGCCSMPALAKGRKTHEIRGFSLVATLLLLLLLTLLMMGLLSLSSITIRDSQHGRAMGIARANARMALMLAIGELQKNTGPDQRITANAEIIDSSIHNKHWLGVWKTTRTKNSREYPLIGKKSDHALESEPYPLPSIYSDLRNQDPEWRTTQRLGWLVSNPNPGEVLDEGSPLVSGDGSQEIVGDGTLGPSGKADEKVVVPKVPHVENGQVKGRYSWWIADNNQKASLNLAARGRDGANVAVSQKDDPGAVTRENGERPYQGYYGNNEAFYKKLDSAVSVSQAALAGADRNQLKADFHDFTADASGLFTDVLNGGLRKDLTPLLLASPSQPGISFSAPDSSWPAAFDSGSPIIPGSRHAMIGPSFDMLRGWARLHTLPDLASGKAKAMVTAPDAPDLYLKPDVDWTPGDPGRPNDPKRPSFPRNDGWQWRWENWKRTAPLFRPVMTEARWHYYFSYTGSGASTKVRTHIIPRVCLWNPYNVAMEVPQLVVLMPNPYWSTSPTGGGGVFEFRCNPGTIAKIKSSPKYQAIRDKRPISEWTTPIIRMSSPATNMLQNTDEGLFPNVRFLSFALKAATIPAGECLVYSPAPDNQVVEAGGIRIGRYDPNSTAKNPLSPEAAQGKDHFYHDMTRTDIGLGGDTAAERFPQDQAAYVPDILGDVFSDGVPEYKDWGYFYDGFSFALKSAQGSLDVGYKEICNSASYPTLQLINPNLGGATTYNYWHYGQYFGSSSTWGFGLMEPFENNPGKQAPRTHQIGVKMMWLDESGTAANPGEAVASPLRAALWGTPRHTVYNQAPIANWNARPTYIGRSPNAFTSGGWQASSMGSWLLQLKPYAPGDPIDLPTSSSDGNSFAKPAFGRATQFGTASMPLFDLPHPDFGVISLGALRHAQLSPFSWHPSYIVGQSLADQNAPPNASAFAELATPFAPSGSDARNLVPTRWDLLCGGNGQTGYGPSPYFLRSQTLLQQGSETPVGIQVEGRNVDVSDELLSYDIAYEVNQNLWDSFFLSSIPMDSGGKPHWSPSNAEPLVNTRYSANHLLGSDLSSVDSKLSSEGGAAFAFWKSAAFVKNRGAFNVNSLSVDAWTSFLSGLRGFDRPMQSGKAGGDGLHAFSRLFKPSASASGSGATPADADAWAGARELTDQEIHTLAGKIVDEVKARGPFISIADFINRRLEATDTPASRSGVLDAAIEAAGLNSGFDGDAEFLTSTDDGNNANKPSLKVNYNRSPRSKAWGATGFLTQGDLLDAIGPHLSARGDTFTIRACGEAVENGVVVARAFLEATVSRGPNFVNPASLDATAIATGANRPTDPVSVVNRADGSVASGTLGDVNGRFGRKYEIVSFRWLQKNEM